LTNRTNQLCSNVVRSLALAQAQYQRPSLVVAQCLKLGIQAVLWLAKYGAVQLLNTIWTKRTDSITVIELKSWLEAFISIRQELLESSPFQKLIRERYLNFLTNPDAIAYAVEGHLRGLMDLGAIDGFDIFHVMEETAATLRIVGLAYFLPSSLLPLEASFRMESGGISFRVLLCSEDELWHGLTSKKQWSAVYLYATVGYEPQWNWIEHREGFLSIS